MPAIIPIPAFSDNYIWLVRRGPRAAVVDPGGAGPVIAHLERENTELVAIVATHHHGDHVGGIPDLLRGWRVPVFGPAAEEIPGRTRAVREGDSFEVDDIELKMSVLDIPGHTAGHIACFNDELVFSGDTLFAAGCGRLFEGTPAQMLASLDKLAALPGDTRVYCGHEYTVAKERETNPFLRVGDAAIAAAASRHAGQPLLGRVSVFAEIRAWKNGFRA